MKLKYLYYLIIYILDFPSIVKYLRLRKLMINIDILKEEIMGATKNNSIKHKIRN